MVCAARSGRRVPHMFVAWIEGWLRRANDAGAIDKHMT